MPQLPPLTPEERAAALAKGVAARKERSGVKHDLKAGRVTVTDVITRAATDAVVAKMKVSDLLAAVPGIGKVRAAQIMTRLDIAETRRIAGLGDRQRAALEDEFAV
jgi:S13-like protein